MDCKCETFRLGLCFDCGEPQFEEKKVKKSPSFSEPKEEETEE